MPPPQTARRETYANDIIVLYAIYYTRNGGRGWRPRGGCVLEEAVSISEIKLGPEFTGPQRPFLWPKSLHLPPGITDNPPMGGWTRYCWCISVWSYRGLARPRIVTACSHVFIWRIRRITKTVLI